jgi:hypothetical protein
MIKCHKCQKCFSDYGFVDHLDKDFCYEYEKRNYGFGHVWRIYKRELGEITKNMNSDDIISKYMIKLSM